MLILTEVEQLDVQVLVDNVTDSRSSTSPFAVEHDGLCFGIDFGATEAVALSHSHLGSRPRDAETAELVRAAAPQRRPPACLHPGMLAERVSCQPDGGVLPLALQPTPQELTEAGAKPIVADAPQLLLERSFWLSGEISPVINCQVGSQNQVNRCPACRWQDIRPQTMETVA